MLKVAFVDGEPCKGTVYLVDGLREAVTHSYSGTGTRILSFPFLSSSCMARTSKGTGCQREGHYYTPKATTEEGSSVALCKGHYLMARDGSKPKAKGKDRDQQRIRVYRAEDRAFAREVSLGSLGAVERFLEEACTSLGVDFGAVELVEGHGRSNRGWATGHDGKGRISLPKPNRNSKGFSRYYALHELAHILCPKASKHGADFAGTMLALVARFMGRLDGERLARGFVEGRVAVSKEAFSYWMQAGRE